MHRCYKSDLAGAIHETCQTLHEHGVIDRDAMDEFDKTCLVDKTLTPEKIRALREENHLSRSVLARHLGVEKELLIAWEKGAEKPAGPALRLLLLLEHKGFEAIRL